MRLKPMNKTSSVSSSSSKNSNNSQEINYEISNNSGESGFDLDMDSGDDEIDVGTHADSMLINFNGGGSSSYSNRQNRSSIINSSGQSEHQYGPSDSPQSSNSFALPQQMATMSEADRKRAHHNALERKRRDHIKDSFHTLRDAIPNIKGEKVSTSRAQILKAATDYIKTMKTRNNVYQNDIDLLKKKNYEIEVQIRQLEKAKLAANQSIKQQQQQTSSNLNQNVLIKTETGNQPYDTDEIEFKFDASFEPSINDDKTNNQTNTYNSLNAPNASNNNNNNSVFILSNNKSTGAAKKFKTIINPKNNILNNGSFF